MNQFLSRRTFILIPTMSILKKIFNPMQVLASSLPSKEDKNNFKIQRISLGIKADISGLEEAKKKLQLVKQKQFQILPQ